LFVSIFNKYLNKYVFTTIYIYFENLQKRLKIIKIGAM